MVEAIFGVGAILGARAGVEAKGNGRIGIGIGVARVDNRLRFFNPHRTADQFFGHCHQARMGEIVEHGGITLHDMGEVNVVRFVDRGARIAHDRAGWITRGDYVALEFLQRLAQRTNLIFGQRLFNDHIAINVEMIALGGGQRGKGPLKAVGHTVRLHIILLQCDQVRRT